MMIAHDHALGRGRVFFHRLVVAERQRLDDAAEQAPNEDARRPFVADTHLEADCAMRHGLARVHLAPLPRAVGA
jgi:hypothetical protein